MPLSSAATIARYTEGDAFQAEKRTVFSRAWLPLCHAQQAPVPGDFVSHSIGGWPVFAVRGADGGLRAFRNVCRHQQMQVVEKPSGHCEELRCRYHGWTYDLAGRFVTAPDTVAPADPAAPGNHLQPLRTHETAGFVLFTLAGDGAPPNAGLDAIVGDAPHTGCVTAEIGCNWKSYVEERLGEDVAFQQPLLIARRAARGAIVEQIVPRTFLRTRVVFHGFGDVQAAVQAHADAARGASEALQARRAAGAMPVLEGRVAMWHADLDAMLATDAAP